MDSGMEINDMDMMAIDYRCTLSVCGHGDAVNAEGSICGMKDEGPQLGRNRMMS